MQFKLKAFSVALGIFIAGSAHATLSFSDLSVSSSSLTFKINGDMSGYSHAADEWFDRQFSIGYVSSNSNPVFDSGYIPNNWSNSVFDNKSIDDSGNTGNWNGYSYTWSAYSSSLVDAVATNRTVTLAFGSNFLAGRDIASLNFYWGNPNLSYGNVATLLGSASTAAVPEPESYAMLLAGLGLMGGIARRRKQK